MRLSVVSILGLFFTGTFEICNAANCSRSFETSIHGLMAVEGKGTEFQGLSPKFMSGTEARIRLFGSGLDKDFVVGVTEDVDSCEYVQDIEAMTKEREHSMIVTVLINVAKHSPVAYYLCVKEKGSTWVHQGTEEWKIFYIYNSIIPIWLEIVLIIFSVSMSALMSGLNLGLMALDISELTVISRSNLGNEKQYAKTILPVRKKGNFLLCTILFSCTLFNAFFTVEIDNIIGNIETVVIVTIVIVILCEIIPQAICSRMPLLIGAKTIYITVAFMVITAPFSYPLGKLLDMILGKENVRYPKERLKELVKIAEIPKSEAAIITGALSLSGTKVGDIMTLIDDVFKLPVTGILDYQTVGEIMFSGYSRIPIYEGDPYNIIHVLLTKDLALIDPSDKVPVLTLCQYSSNLYKYIPFETTLDVAFKILKEDGKHMAFVTLKDDQNKDTIVGLLTLEDIIEELLQEEIFDETDIIADNRSKRKIASSIRRENIAMLLRKYGAHSVSITPQMKSAACNYLSSYVKPFMRDKINPAVLKKVLNFNFIERLNPAEGHQDYIYMKGKKVDFFVMILEGRVQVCVGQEDLSFEGGPFFCFGHLALNLDEHVDDKSSSESGLFYPDYSVSPKTDVIFLKIERSVYLAALKVSGLIPFNEAWINESKTYDIYVALLEWKESEKEDGEKGARN